MNDNIKQLIIVDEIQATKQSQRRFKLIDRQNEALFQPSNYQIICKKCHPGKQCARHFHIAYCSMTGPNPNAKFRATRNGPDRINQRLFRQNLKDLVYQNPEINFMPSFQETKKNLFPDLPVNYAESCGIAADIERQAYYHLYSHKCKFPIDITSNSNMIEFCNFQTRKPQSEEFRHERNNNIYFFIPSHLPIVNICILLIHLILN